MTIFFITSPKNADTRIFGWVKANMGRLMGKSPKKGIIITIKGTRKNDSLFGETKIPLFGELKFKGIATKTTLNGEFYDDDNASIGSLHGLNSQEDSMKYGYIYSMLIKTIQDNIYSKSVLQTNEWKKF